MRTDTAVFEADVLELVRTVLSFYRESLQSLNITPRNPKLTRRWSILSEYQSEITIDFYDKKGVVDVIEFYVYRSGIPNASKNEIKKWLTETLENLVDDG